MDLADEEIKRIQTRRETKIIERPIENNRKSTLNNERKVVGS